MMSSFHSSNIVYTLFPDQSCCGFAILLGFAKLNFLFGFINPCLFSILKCLLLAAPPQSLLFAFCFLQVYSDVLL